MTDMVLPQFGMGMSDGTIIAWHKAVGDKVKQGEPLCDVEAAKTTVEVVAPCDGILQKIVVPAGSNALVNTVIAIIGNEAAVVVVPEPEPAADTPLSATLPPPSATLAPPPVVPPKKALEVTRPATAPSGNEPQIEPRARRAARAQNIDLRSVTGTGPGGRIIEEDVMRSATANLVPAAALAPTTAFSPPLIATGKPSYQLRMRCNAAPLNALLDQLAPYYGQALPVEAALLRMAALIGAATTFAGSGIGVRADDGTITTERDPITSSLLSIAKGLETQDNSKIPDLAMVIEWHAEDWIDDTVCINPSGPACLAFSAVANGTDWQINLTTGDHGPSLADGKAMLKQLKSLFETPLAILA